MNDFSRTWIVLMLALVIAVYLPAAWASGCGREDVQAARQASAQLRKAEEAERAGKLKPAFDTLTGNREDSYICEDGFEDKRNRHRTALKRIGLQLGQQEEKQGRLDAAFDLYLRSRNEAEADRVKMNQANASPRDLKVVSSAIGHFKFRNNNTRVTELRQLAAKNADLELAGEDKAFAARKESFEELNKAKDWFYLAGAGAEKMLRNRIEWRGDSLLKEDTYRHLENAKRYFGMVEAKPKEKAVQDKALRLAQEHEKKGEITQARNFYGLAGASAKGNELEERSAAQQKKSEEKRQKQFAKDQGDLEKQLGL